MHSEDAKKQQGVTKYRLKLYFETTLTWMQSEKVNQVYLYTERQQRVSR